MKPLTGVLAITLATGSFSACRAHEPAPELAVHPPIAVTVVPVTAVAGFEHLEAGGVVAAEESATVSSRLVATIASVRVKAGDRVRAGEILLTLDARDVEAHAGQVRATALAAEKSLTQARAERDAAEADHGLAAAWQARIATLHARSSATDQERDDARARLTSAAARLEGTRAAIDVAEAQLAAARAGTAAAVATASFATLRAPFDGVITERLIDAGNLAAPGVPLLRVESDGARQVIARVDEARAAFVHPGDRVDVEIEVHESPVAPGDRLEGTVVEVARAVGADQRAVTVKMALPRTVSARSGSFARVVFNGAPRHSLLAPASAIRRRGQVSTVFVVRDGVAQLRLVRAGPAARDGVEVLAGLDAGESVVTSPPPGLIDGSRVSASVAAFPLDGSR